MTESKKPAAKPKAKRESPVADDVAAFDMSNRVGALEDRLDKLERQLTSALGIAVG